MSEELEVEVQDNVSSVDAVRQMMDKMASGDVTGANDAFNAVMGELRSKKWLTVCSTLRE